ncbi:MAG: nuclear transport factor 2 family protein [Gemmatimonadota bacterium]
MTVAEVANGLKSLCERGQFLEAVDRYYAEDVESVEPVDLPHLPAVVRGFNAVRKKTEGFGASFDVHEVRTEGPYVGEDGFALYFWMDATQKASGSRQHMTEVGWYTVRDGKVVHEEFFYHMPGA